jgi:hypothetical protein
LRGGDEVFQGDAELVGVLTGDEGVELGDEPVVGVGVDEGEVGALGEVVLELEEGSEAGVAGAEDDDLWHVGGALRGGFGR